MPPLCLVHGTRVVPLEVGPTTRLTFADPRERRDLGGRRVAVTVRADRVEIEDESGDGVSVRGERKRRHVVGPGEAVAVGHGSVPAVGRSLRDAATAGKRVLLVRLRLLVAGHP